MKQCREFVVNALVSGLLVVVPVYLALLLLLKAMQSLVGLVRPFALLLPEWFPAENALSLLLVLVVCFLIGVAVRTPTAQAASYLAFCPIFTAAKRKLPMKTMMNAQRLVAIGASLLPWVLLATLCTSVAAQEKPAAATGTKVRTLAIANKPWTGDFDKLVARRIIRVLVPYSRTLFFNDKGREHGLTAELVRDFERYLNQKHRQQLGKRPITVFMISTTRDKLLSNVVAGLGDIAAGNLTITEDRQEIVDFVALQVQEEVSELLVTGPKSPAIGALDDLAGKRVHVRQASSYAESLVALNERFNTAGKPPMTLTFVSDALEDEDMLEMLEAGLFEAIVVDDWKARMWAQILPQIRVHDEVVLRSGGKIGWAIRQGSPMLAEAIMDFFQNFAKKQGVIEYRLARYHKAIKQIQDPTDTTEWQRFEQTLTLFEQYGQQYAFERLLLAAQGYQESQLRQDAKSHVGAIGIMQLMPATGARDEGGRHHGRRVEHPRRHEIPRPLDDQVFPRRPLQRVQPAVVCVRQLQRRARQHCAHA